MQQVHKVSKVIQAVLEPLVLKELPVQRELLEPKALLELQVVLGRRGRWGQRGLKVIPELMGQPVQPDRKVTQLSSIGL